jgi:predicted HAD superfamily phosphohydrolase YqeG
MVLLLSTLHRIVTFGKAVKCEPEARTVRLIIKDFDLNPQATTIVGDQMHDIFAGKDNGIFTIGGRPDSHASRGHSVPSRGWARPVTELARNAVCITAQWPDRPIGSANRWFLR